MELPGQLQTALAAVNSGDGLAFAGCFAPTVGVVNDWGRTFRGAEAINTWCVDRFTHRGVQLAPVHAYPGDQGDVVLIANITDAGTTSACTFLVSLRTDGTIDTMRVIG